METKANYVLIGAFTLAVVAAAFGFVFWFQNLGAAAQAHAIAHRVRGRGFRSAHRRQRQFQRHPRSAKSPPSSSTIPSAWSSSPPSTRTAPIRKDSLVGLEFAGLTGVSSISLKGGSLEAGGVPVAEDGVPTLTADPNAIQDIGEAVRGVLQNVNKLVMDNQETLHASMANIEVFSKSLASNAARIDSIMAGVDGLMGEKGELQVAARSFRELAENLDKRSAGLIIDGRRTLADISRAVNNFDRNPTRVLFGAGQKDAAPVPNPADARARQR